MTQRPALRLRLLSALVMLPVALAAVLAGGVVFSVLVAVCSLALIYEWNRMCIGAGLGWTSALHAGVALAGIVLVALDATLVALVLVAVATAAFLAARGLAPRTTLWPALGLVCLCLPVLAIVWLRARPDVGEGATLWLLIAIWATDTGAYLFGRAIGGPKLAPRISPQKTWAGLYGGALAAGVVGGAVGFLTMPEHGALLAAAAMVVAVFAQAGDIAESALKRRFGRKDTSGLIPGHGGVMDRLDGLLFTAPFAAVMAYTLGW